MSVHQVRITTYTPTLPGAVSRVKLVSQAVTGPQGTSGTGGDMMKADNLAGLANVATARTNLGLGTAATTAATAYATAAQGAKADTAVQPAALAAYQPLDTDLTDLAGIADAQGDIIVRGASGWERLAKSATSTDVLTAGATQPVWAAVSGGGVNGGVDISPTGTGYGFHMPVGIQNGGGQSAATPQRAAWFPYWMPRAAKLTITIYCFTLEAGSSARLCVWSHDSTTFKPSALVEDLGTVSGAATGAKSLTATIDCAAGWNWVGIWASNHSTVRWGRGSGWVRGPMGDDAAYDGRYVFGWHADSVDYLSAWSSTLPTLTASNNVSHFNNVVPYVRFT